MSTIERMDKVIMDLIPNETTELRSTETSQKKPL